jgi:hypothetical protein
MITARETVGIAAVVVGSAVLAAVSHHAGGQATQARAVVQTAADRLTRQQIADAWTRAKLGNTTRLDDIIHGVGLRYRSTHQEDDAIILAFNGPAGRCVDLISRPEANTVRTRRC